MQHKFNSSFIPDRSKILGFFTIVNGPLDFALAGNETNLDAYVLDFDQIEKNTGYFKQDSTINMETEFLSDYFTEVISRKEYVNELNYILFNFKATGVGGHVYEFDY